MDKLDLNNKVILLRKSLKSIFNQTKLNLSRKIKNLKKNEKQKQSALRKESEFEALKRLKPLEIPLCEAVHPDKLQKTLTNPSSTERDRAIARVLLNPLVQKTIKQLKEKLGPETVETFLKENEKNIKKNIKQKLENPKKSKDKKKKVKKESESEDSDQEIESEDEVGEESDEERNIEEIQSGSEVDGDEGTDEDLKEDSEEDGSEDGSDLEELEISNENKEESSQKVTKIAKETTKLEKTAQETPESAPADTKPPKRKRFKEEIVKKSADPFFMVAPGQNYLAAVADGDSTGSDGEEEDENPRLVRKNPQKTNKNIPGKKFKPIKPRKFDETPPAKKFSGNLKSKSSKQPQKNQESQIQKKFENFKKPENTKKLEMLKNPENTKKPDMKSKTPATPDDGDIHPSWKAKAQMRKTQIQNFQGTKIKFDD